MASSVETNCQSMSLLARSWDTTCSPTLIRIGNRLLSNPSSELATATLRLSTLSNGFQLDSTLNHAKKEGIRTTPTSTIPAITLRVACP